MSGNTGNARESPIDRSTSAECGSRTVIRAAQFTALPMNHAPSFVLIGPAPTDG